MKITFLTNACAIYEAQGFRILSDPWLSESVFEGAWIHDPPITTKPQDVLDVDALYISHLHQDHADHETLKYFRRDIPIITLHDTYSFCAKHLAKMGFSKVVAVPDKHQIPLGPFQLTMFAPFVKHPFHDSDIGNVVDSAILFEADGVKVLNCNDNSPSAGAARLLGETYGPIDVAQINFNNAGPYPACFMNLTREEKIAEHHKSIERNLSHMAEVAIAMKAKAVMPFAGAFKLSSKWDHMNEYLGATSDKNAVEYLKKKDINAFTLAEGEVYNVG